MSKEAQRRAAARKQQRNAKAAKWVIVALMIAVVPILVYLVMQR